MGYFINGGGGSGVGALVTRGLTLGPISFIFIQFRQKSCQIIGFRPKVRGCRLPREILDPPLLIIVFFLKTGLNLKYAALVTRVHFNDKTSATGYVDL